MRAVIKIEEFRVARRGRTAQNTPRRQAPAASVHKLVRIEDTGPVLAAVHPYRDFSQSNSVGSRGVYLYYFLQSGVYHVRAPVSWGRVDDYWCRVLEDGSIERLTFDDVLREEN